MVENINILNVNDLAMSLRMAYLPGEKMMLELTQKGQDSHQAVGHLTDGTMVVVEHANNRIGQTVEIEFIRSLQTAAGKMMFAKLTEDNKNLPTKKPAPKDKKPSQYQNNRPNRYPNKQSNRSYQPKTKPSNSEQDVVDLINKQ
jgi:hypothetical protein